MNDHRLLVHAERCEPTDELLAYLGMSPAESAAGSLLASGRLAPLAAGIGIAGGCALAALGVRCWRRGRNRRRARRRLRGWARGTG